LPPISNFGPFNAFDCTTAEALEFPRNKAAALLAVLASPVGRRQSRAELCDLLWGNFAEEQARDSLRQRLFVIRKMILDSAAPIARSDNLTLLAKCGGEGLVSAIHT
jgi:DNA-binding SARP family transcriptional activator